jgi:hypothetical protein
MGFNSAFKGLILFVREKHCVGLFSVWNEGSTDLYPVSVAQCVLWQLFNIAGSLHSAASNSQTSYANLPC